MAQKPTYEELEQRVRELEKAGFEGQLEEGSLQEQVLYHRVLMDVSLDGIAIIDQNHRVVESNRRFAEMLGYTPEEVLSLHTWDWEAIMSEAEIRANFADLTKTKTTFGTRHRRKDGTIYDAEVTACGAKLGDEAMILTIVRDITDRKEAELALKQSESRYRTLFENMSDGVAIYEAVDDGEDFFFVGFNEAAERIENIPKEEILGRRVVDVFPGVNQFGLLDVFRRVWKTGRSERHPVSMYKDERIFGWRDNFVYKLPSGEIVAIYSDETRNKQAEEALRQEKDLLRRVIETSPAGITIVNQQGKITFANSQAEKVLGLAKKAITERTYNQPAWHITDYDGNPFPDEKLAFSLVMATGQPVQDVRHAIEWPNGRKIFLSINAAPLLAQSGEVSGMVATVEDITERKRAEEELLKERDLAQKYLDTAGALIMVLDAKGQITLMNKMGCNILGYEADKLIGRKFVEHYCPQSVREQIRNNFQRLVNAQIEEVNYENPILTREGKERIIIWQNRLLYDEAGKYLGMISSGVDITDRKKAEDALRESEERFRFLTENLADIVWTVDLSFRTTYVSPSITKILGFTPEERKRQPIDETMTQESLRILNELFVSEFDREKTGKTDPERSISVETEYYHKDGATVWLESTMKWIRDAKGDIVGIHGVSRDITKRKRAEEALWIARERLQKIVEESPIGIAFLDEKREIFFTNQRYRNFLGYSEAEIIERGPKGLLHPDDWEPTMAMSIQMRSGEIPVFRKEQRYIRKDGKTVWSETQITPLRDKEGRLIHTIGWVQDITERKREEEERKKLQAQLQQAQKMEALGTLAGGIAHDFNNLLMAIQGRASIMLMDKDSSHPDFEHLTGIESYVESASDLTKQLLGFARGGKYEVKPTNLNELIEKENRMFGRTKKEITIHGKYAEDLWSVEIDRGQIDQVLLNLYVNAWQAMPGGGDLYVETENVMLDENYVIPFQIEPGKYVKISVTDTGIGMDKATQEKIFDPFF
ncbi:MAG: PAS domain S-box protein, partial [Deltaproteobacteria bacterium]|nr:PAS domain S-box protein [Deltaproteobacteria bacterium]